MRSIAISVTALYLIAPLPTIAWIGLHLPAINLPGQSANLPGQPVGLTEGANPITLFSQARGCE